MYGSLGQSPEPEASRSSGKPGCWALLFTGALREAQEERCPKEGRLRTDSLGTLLLFIPWQEANILFDFPGMRCRMRMRIGLIVVPVVSWPPPA